MNWYNVAIPKSPEIKGWESVRIKDCEEKLIPLSQIAYGHIIVKSQYYSTGIPGALEECYARETVGKMLVSASKNLPAGYKFVVWDAWRPLMVQKYVLDYYIKKLKEDSTELPDDKLIEYAKKYVSLPSDDPKKPSPHSTGGAIDLTIQDAERRYLEMGTAFDAFEIKAGTRYYEDKEENGEALSDKEKKYKENRRLLY